MVDAENFNNLMDRLNRFVNTQGRGERTNIKPDFFYEKGMEDLYEWIEQLDHAADANGWEGMRIVTQGVNYLKGVARRWY